MSEDKAHQPLNALIVVQEDHAEAVMHQAALLMQLRTGHILLRKHLHRIGKAGSAMCPACLSEDESVHHYLLVSCICCTKEADRKSAAKGPQNDQHPPLESKSFSAPVQIHKVHSMLPNHIRDLSSEYVNDNSLQCISQLPNLSPLASQRQLLLQALPH